MNMCAERFWVLCQDIVSTPWADLDSGFIKHNRDYKANRIMHLRQIFFEGLKRGLVIQ